MDSYENYEKLYIVLNAEEARKLIDEMEEEIGPTRLIHYDSVDKLYKLLNKFAYGWQ